MKKIVFSGLLIFALFSCNTNEVDETKTSEVPTIEELKEAANMHNEALDYLLEEMEKDNSAVKTKETESAQDFFNSKLNEFYEAKLPTNDIADAKTYSSQAINEGMTKLSQKSYSADYNISKTTEMHKEIFSTEQIEALHSVEKILQSSDVNYESALLQLDSLETTVITNFTQEESFPILATLYVGKASIQYWHENYSKWAAVISDRNFSTKWGWWDEFSMADLGTADAGGALGGAAGALVVNVIPGIGQAAYGGAIIGGAVGNSVLDAFNQVVNGVQPT